MSFNFIPFSIVEEKVMDCQYGEHYYKNRTASHTKKSVRLQGSRKIGCPAKIRIKKFALYPDYGYTEGNVSIRRKQQEQHSKLKKLKQDLKRFPSSITTIYKYYISLPTEDAHRGHSTGERAGFSQKLHPAVIKRIYELVYAGITNITEIKRSLKLHVTEAILPYIRETPSVTNRAFYPLDSDIHNHVSLAKRALQFSRLDQDNVKQLMVLNWKLKHPSLSSFFQPYKSANNDAYNAMAGISITDSSLSEIDCFTGKGDIPTIDTCSTLEEEHCIEQPLLLVLQEEWQKKILERYGNTICLIDATYKTTQYDLPLFFICVRTNVSYIVVAEFIVQSEESDQIKKALQILKSWNPTWNPRFFMSDYSEAELLALEAVFPSVHVYLCDFHREQCWERWVKNSKHGLTKEDAQILLSLLRDCADALPSTTADIPFDQPYLSAVSLLKKSHVWRNNEAVRHWLETMWLNIPKVS